MEGPEGVGKTTQVRRLAKRLKGVGLPVLTTREPGGTRVGEAIRSVLLDRRLGAIVPETELLLILAARAAFVREVVAPALAAGTWVVSDRFDLSSLAYQGYGRGIDLARVRRLNRDATGGLAADLHLVLDMPARSGAERQRRAGKSPDRFESGGSDFLQRVRRGYVELARSMDRVVLVSGEGSRDEVEARIGRELDARFPELADRSPEADLTGGGE